MKVKNMETNDIKMMLTAINRQLKYTDSYSKKILKEYYKDYIEACENELTKRGISIDTMV